MKRRQYDTYGVAGLDPSRAGSAGRQQYHRAGGATVDPEELFRKIFGEFTGGRGFKDVHHMFDRRPEVRPASGPSVRRPPVDRLLSDVSVPSSVRDGADVLGGGPRRRQAAGGEPGRLLSALRGPGQRAGDPGRPLPLLQRHRHGGATRGAVALSRTSCVAELHFLQETVSTGPFTMRSACRRCGGKGTIINTPCALCRGSGLTKKRQTLTVPVPAGRFKVQAERWTFSFYTECY